MYERVTVPVDGSPFAETVIPYALGLARAMKARLAFLRIVEERAADAAEEYLRGLADRLGAERTLLLAEAKPASVILQQMEKRPNDLLAMTTHGRGGVLESLLGSVALHVVRESLRPLVVYRPREAAKGDGLGEAVKISTVIAPVDGSDFSERILVVAAGMAKAIGAGLTLLQAVPPAGLPASIPASDVLESSYVRRTAEKVEHEYGIDADWEVLHGPAGDAISDYAKGQTGVLLAMSSHARTGLKQTILGSVTAECLRRSGAPILVFGPGQPRAAE